MGCFSSYRQIILLCSCWSALLLPSQASFIESFVNRATSDEHDFDDEVPHMLQEMILSGEMNHYVNFDAFFSERVLNETNSNNSTNSTPIELRPCDELIHTFTAEEIKVILKDYLLMMLDSDAKIRGSVEAWIDRKWTYGLKAYKICASCTDFRDEYSGVGGESRDAFDTYCAEGLYGADETHSGLLQIPVDENGEFTELESDVALWNRWLAYTATECPSETFLNETYWGRNITELEPRGYSATGFVTSGIGFVTLLPDYIGFCESYQMDVAPANKRAYQTGVVPLVLKMNAFVKEKSGGKVSTTNYVVSSGFSEGAMPSIVVGNALHDAGFRVRTQSGGGAIDHTSKNGLFHIYAEVIENGLSIKFATMIAGWAATYSSTNPDLPNTGNGQDFLSDEYRDTILGWYRGTEKNFNEFEIEAALEQLPVDSLGDIFNPDIHEMIMSARKNDNVEDVCELAEEGKTDKFCEAVALNDIKKDLAEIKHVTRLCWASSDELFLFRANVPPTFTRLLNFKLRTLLIPGIFLDPGESGVALDHQTAGGYCLVLDALFFHLL